MVGGVDVVPLQGAIVVCYGGGDDQIWGSGRSAIAGCHCRVPLWCALGEWTQCHCWVPLQGAIVVCYGGGRGG